MDGRALTGGASVALGLRLLDRISRTDPLDLRLPEPYFCPELPPWWEIHPFSLLLGVLLGFSLGPLLEAILTVRWWIYQSAVRQIGQSLGVPDGPRRPHYRIL